MKRRFLVLMLLVAGAACGELAAADSLVVSLGTSVTSEDPHASLGEYLNHSNNASVRYEGEHYGLRVDHSSHGDDASNTYVTGDSLVHFGPMLAGAGIMVDTKPLRQVGSRMNFHAMVGMEVQPGDLLSQAGLGFYFDHWSNGHIHALFGPDNVRNPPRNVVSLGLIIPIR